MSRHVGLGKLRRRLLAVGSPILLVALLPSLLYVGHWQQLAGGLAGRPPEATDDDHRVHEDHCHIDLEGCADQPAPPGPEGFVVVVLPVQPEGFVAVLADPAQTLEGRTVTPPSEPPRGTRVG